MASEFNVDYDAKFMEVYGLNEVNADGTHKVEHKVKEPDKVELSRGYLGYLTQEQKDRLAELRSALKDEYKDRLDTPTLLRFLRARKFDVNAAKQMFIECEKWRKETMLDDLVPTWDYVEKDKMAKYYPQFYHKTDKDGRPIYIEKLGKINLSEMRKITSDARMLDNLAVEYEKCADPRFPACSRRFGYVVETCCTIMDLKDVGIRSATQVYEYVKQASVISQNYYPERLGKLYIINAPWGFSYVWSVIKGYLDPVTVKKIHILGDDYSKELLKQIDAENLPKELGGTCQCPYEPYVPKEGEKIGQAELNETNEKRRLEACRRSDAGPWTDEQWKKPAWWEDKAKKDAAMEKLEGTAKDPKLTQKTETAVTQKTEPTDTQKTEPTDNQKTETADGAGSS